MNTKVLVLGSSGMVGSRFVELSKLDLLTPNHLELDITNRQSVTEYFQNNSFEAVINFAAYTNVSEAEKQRENEDGDCWRINVIGLENILYALKPETFFIQISSDMIFSGSSGPYDEVDKSETDSNKVTWYGFTKGEAERLIGGRGTIVRIIYPVRAKYDQKLDYLRKPLSLYDQAKLYPLFTDQQINITYIDELCVALGVVLDKRLKGVFHIASCDLTTPHELISYYISKTRGLNFSAQKGTVDPMRYPKYGGLNVSKTEKELGLRFSSWQEIIGKLLAKA